MVGAGGLAHERRRPPGTMNRGYPVLWSSHPLTNSEKFGKNFRGKFQSNQKPDAPGTSCGGPVALDPTERPDHRKTCLVSVGAFNFIT